MALLDTGLNFDTNVTNTTTISYNSGSVAEFEIQFTNYTNATASVAFILPADLTAGYSDNLPISSSANSGLYHVGTQLNPSNGIVNAAMQAGAHDDYLRLEAPQDSILDQVAGNYSGSLVPTVHY